MARYIDADNFRKTMIKRFGCIPCLTDYSEASRYDMPIDDALNLAPTADVVPKSEYDRLEKLFNDMTQEAKGYLNKIYGIRADVAREIFESIEECIYLYYNKNDYTMPNIEEDIAELKKIYTENENG